MKLTFLGTRGYIEEKMPRHKYHSSLLLEERGYKLLIDHGVISKPLSLSTPDAILITHAHPDTFKWVVEDEDFNGPMYVTRETKRSSRFRQRWRIIQLGRKIRLGPFRILPYRVLHSIRAPAVGFRIRTTTNAKTLVYNSDLIAIPDPRILKRVDLYIGDGSSYRANLVRVRGKKLVGHARMSTQVHWCQKHGITNIIFTHLGKEPLGMGDSTLKAQLVQKGMDIRIAYDGMVYTL